MQFKTPDIDMPEGLNIRLVDLPVDQEARLLRHKINAAEAFARENRIDQRGLSQAGAKIGIVAAGKTGSMCSTPSRFWALIRTRPCDWASRHIRWCKLGRWIKPAFGNGQTGWFDHRGEEKRKLIEPQIKDAYSMTPIIAAFMVVKKVILAPFFSHQKERLTPLILRNP